MSLARKIVSRRKAAEKHGRRSETYAAVLLRLKGYRILGRRVRTRAGEIDMVARAPGGVICFVEVKARKGDGLAVDSLGVRQQQRIVRAAQLYLAARPKLAAKGIRFDVIIVVPGRLPQHRRDAWRSDGA